MKASCWLQRRCSVVAAEVWDVINEMGAFLLFKDIWQDHINCDYMVKGAGKGLAHQLWLPWSSGCCHTKKNWIQNLGFQQYVIRACVFIG